MNGMNKQVSLCLCALLLGSGAQALAQSETLAVGLVAQQESRGSARYRALSGAMGAVGADFGSVHQNPAGIGLFSSGNKLSLTSGYTSQRGRSTWGDNAYGVKSSQFLVDEMSYMTSWRSDRGASFTFGLGIQNGGRLHRRLDASTSLNHRGGFSLADYSAAILNNLSPFISPAQMLAGDKPFSSGAPWLGVLAHEAAWINYDDTDKLYGTAYHFTDTDGHHSEGPRSVGLKMNEDGAITHYDFAFGYRPSSFLSLGALLTFSHLAYDLRTSYSEGFRPRAAHGDTYGLSLDNGMNIFGSGVRLGLGAVIEPIDGLRLGASVYTPMVYQLKVDHWARATGVSPSYPDREGAFDVSTPSDAADAFRLSSPWRFGLSGAYVFGRKAILSVDYEYTDLQGVRLGNHDEYDGGRDNLYDLDNQAIEEDFVGSGQHTLRLGLEVNASRRLALRAGYRMTTAQGVHQQLSQDVHQVQMLVPGTLPHYRLPGATDSFSLGFGYRMTPDWSLDMTYVYDTQHSRAFAFPYIQDKKLLTDAKQPMEVKPIRAIEDRQSRSQVLLTLGYRF